MEDEIKVGEYVRTEKGISKIMSQFGSMNNKIIYEADKNGTSHSVDSFNCYVFDIDITKHSSNIIDLIEVRRLCKWV